MKKLLFLIVLIGALVAGYLLGAGKSGRLTSDTGARDLRRQVGIRTALSLNKHLDGTEIEVTVRDAAVELRGKVRTQAQLNLAEEIAASIEGIAKVRSRLLVDPTLPDPNAADGERSLGQRLDDITAETRARTALALHRDIKRGEVDVDVMKGEARLTGTVPSWAARELAGKVVEDVEGVNRVNNELRVSATGVAGPGEGMTQYLDPEGRGVEQLRVPRRMADGSIRLQIEAALHVNPYIEARRVNVEVMNGQVYLRGYARSEADKALIHKIAEDAWGVRFVTNEIVVDPAPNAPLEYAPSSTTERNRTGGP